MPFLPFLLISPKIETHWWDCEVLSQRRSCFHRIVLSKRHYFGVLIGIFQVEKIISSKNAIDFFVLDQWFSVSIIEKEGKKEHFGRFCLDLNE